MKVRQYSIVLDELKSESACLRLKIKELHQTIALLALFNMTFYKGL